MAMTLEDARARVQICNGHIQPKQVGEDAWICINCGVGLAEEKKNASGFCHHFDPGNEKKCTECKELKPVTDFYYRKGALDNRFSFCKDCARNDTNLRERRLKLKGKTRHLWLPTDLWNAIEKIKGHQTFRDFVVIACRKEVERRTRDLVLQRTLDGIKESKPVRM